MICKIDLRREIILLFFLILGVSVYGQQKKYAVYSMAFYNVENLFDTVRDSLKLDEEFTASGGMNWTADKYRKKQKRVASVIQNLGNKHCPVGPAFIGLSEIENRKVLEDLVAQPALQSKKYEIVHYDSPDRRGIDVALLYNPSLFKYINSQVFGFKLPSQPDYVTRDILLVKGILANETVHVFVNHWPSRFGAKSSVLREHAASILKSAVDSIQQHDPNSKIIIMGDFNDDPVDKSVKYVLRAKENKDKIALGELYNTMSKHYSKGIGSLGYQAKWSLFDQIIISGTLIGDDRKDLKFWKSEIHNPDYLITKDGRYKGYPLRTFSGNLFQDGYSDHFPVLIYLLKEVE